MSEAYNRRDIFREILALNPTLRYRDVMQITSRPERTVLKWMSGGSEPDLFSMQLLREALYRAGKRTAGVSVILGAVRLTAPPLASDAGQKLHLYGTPQAKVGLYFWLAQIVYQSHIRKYWQILLIHPE